MKKPIPFGKYYLLERINVGGMAEVFRAKAYGVEGFERLVAVKRILPNIAEDKEFIGMFIDEAKIAVQLNHANIAQIFDLGVVDGSYYIALEHVHGRDLRAIFDRCRGGGEPMPIAQACFVIMKTCEGLDYAHNKRDQGGRELGLVHRDVSPQNVLVSFEGEVKLIDFGIAKAAGKGSKTQAGILKGKFGYMSPEQVRGLPIDRRSDVFSCGIVLYELLTGERLFVGESDFSTLEKVRNVEILPPSTYNRKIPDELERIVLKALAKDVEDRYRNAIDLHDELQAFVYTAGEFYSRKDLAGWMKDTFVKEIEEESKKLEEFRHIAPPELRPPQVRQRRPDPAAPPRSTLSMPAVGTKPPPIPTRSGRPSGNMPAVPRPLSQTQPPVEGPMAASAAPSHVDLDWDEEELETAIYDEPNPPGGRPNTSSAQMAIAPGAQTVEQDSGQDLSSLVSSARSWNQAKEVSPLPAPIADGSNQTASALHDEDATVEGPTRAHPPAQNDSSAVAAIAALGQRDRQYRPTFGEGIISQRRESNAGLFAAIAALALLLVGGGLAIFFLARDKGDDKSTSAVAAVAPGGDAEQAGAGKAGAGAEPAVVDPDTGFDLIVDPAGVKVKLDGAEIGKAPLQIRNLKAGDHQVEIVAPSGFFNKTQTVRVTRGAADRVVIKLDAMEVVGNFKSKPSGAVVSLISDTERRVLGRSPVSAKLDPRQRYQVMFKKDRYTTMTKSVEFGDGTEVEVAVRLEKDRGDDKVASADPKKRPDLLGDPKKDPKKDPVKDPNKDPVKDPKKDPNKDPKKDPVKKPPESKYGTLAVGSKPPCRIFIDGRDTGRRTPARGIKLKAGKHRLTLVNNEFSIKKSYTVKIKQGEQTRAIKNLTKFIEGN